MTPSPRIVLVRTSHPGNIGAAARAMKTMGLSQLVLVEPRRFPDAEAVAMAAGAEDVLERALVVDGFETAIADCDRVYGLTARSRSVALPEMNPREAVQDILNGTNTIERTALVFGNERTGLLNSELSRCHVAIHIPANPDYSSLNLAAAVQVMAYEWRMSCRHDWPQALQTMAPQTKALPAELMDDPKANVSQVEGFFSHLEIALRDIEFFKASANDTIMQRLRRLFLKTELTQREVQILRGILSETQRMARLAKSAPKE